MYPLLLIMTDWPVDHKENRVTCTSECSSIKFSIADACAFTHKSRNMVFRSVFLHHRFPLTQCCVQLVRSQVMVYVLHVLVTRFRLRKGRSSALPALQEPPLWPREPSLLLTVSEEQTQLSQHTFYREIPAYKPDL